MYSWKSDNMSKSLEKLLSDHFIEESVLIKVNIKPLF